MKVAFITEDGINISRHFGRASHYLVVQAQDGRAINREMREKPHHTQHGPEHENNVVGPYQHQHGSGHAEPLVHDQMASVISDCDTLICGGMGRGAHMNLTERGIKLVLTEMNKVDEALQAYLEGRLIDRSEEMLH